MGKPIVKKWVKYQKNIFEPYRNTKSIIYQLRLIL